MKKIFFLTALFCALTSISCHKYSNINKEENAILCYHDFNVPFSINDSICGFYLKVGMSPYFKEYKIENPDKLAGFNKLPRQSVSAEFTKVGRLLFNCQTVTGQSGFRAEGISIISIQKKN